jgi:hypothetical protein
MSAKITIGAEVIDLTTLPAAPLIVPVALTSPTPPPITVPTLNLTAADLPPVFLPLFSIGNTANGISCFNIYSAFVTQLNADFAAATPASVAGIDAHGTYNRATNTFTANTINVVLD